MEITELLELEKGIREADLEALEAYRKGTAEAPVVYKATGHMKVQTNNDGMMVFVASEESEDRLGDIVEAKGWELTSFRANPVFMFVHDYSVPPVGLVPKVWVERKQLLNLVKWDEGDEFARQLKGKYERGFMRGESVGFRAMEFEEMGHGGIRFTKQELLEISAVPIPAHPAALRKAMGNKFTIWMPELHPVAFESRPLPNEHSCRLRSPDDFQPNSFRRMTREHEGKEYHIIMGRLEGETTMTEQAYRYPKDGWTTGQARTHCKSYDGSFEAASEEARVREISLLDGPWLVTRPHHPGPHADEGDSDTGASEATKGKISSFASANASAKVESALVLDKEGKAILAIKGTRADSVDISQDEVDSIRGSAVFVHNHPSGSPFSPGDISFGAKTKQGKMVVTTDQYVYTISPKGGKWKDQSTIGFAYNSQMVKLRSKYQGMAESKGATVAFAEASHEAWTKVSIKRGFVYERETR